MLTVALNIDVELEIQKRLKGARRAIEESSEQYDQYSARSQSIGVASEDQKKKKRVNFASPERYSSVNSYEQSSDAASSRYKSSGKNIEDSIGESIKIEDSYNTS